jgi:hypothetical protein
VDALAQRLARNSAEESEHAYVAGTNPGDCTEKQYHEQECRNSQANEAKQAAAGATTINNFAASWIENRHRMFSPVLSKKF